MVLIVLVVAAAMAPIPLPDCVHGIIHLDARPYFQEGVYGYDECGCLFIGAPGTTIVGGLICNSFDFPSLAGSILFDGGSISSWGIVNISGENMSIVDCSIVGQMGVTFSGHVDIMNSQVEAWSGRSIQINNATIGLRNSTLSGYIEGYLVISNSMANMADVKVGGINSALFSDSVVSVLGQSWIHGTTGSGPFGVDFLNPTATFQNGTDVITADDSFHNGVEVSLMWSSLTLRNCTSINRALHNSTPVQVTAGSLLSCIPSDTPLLV